MDFPLFEMLYKETKNESHVPVSEQDKLIFIKFIERCNRDGVHKIFMLIKYYGMKHEYIGNPIAKQYEVEKIEKGSDLADYKFDFDKFPKHLQRILIRFSHYHEQESVDVD